MLLTPKQTRRAVEHVLHVHKLEEAKRRQLAECTDSEELREAMLECGLPEADVDRAIKGLPAALAAEVIGKQKRIIVALAVLLVIAIGGVTLQALNARKVVPGREAEAAAPVKKERISVYLRVEAEVPSDASTRIAQDAFSEALSKEGFNVIEDVAVEMSKGKFAIVGKANCQLIGTKIFGTNMSTYRTMVVVRVLDGRSGETLGSMNADSGAMALVADKGCSDAARAATQKALPEVLSLLSALKAAPPAAP